MITWKQELEDLAKRNDGVLMPETVVDHAKNPKSALHDKFEWDNTKAAHAHRLWQARMLIRVVVQYYGPEQTEPYRAYVSLTTDRGVDGGYRRTVDVLRHEDMRDILLRDARVEMESFRAKYRGLKELADVVAAMDKHLEPDKHTRRERKSDEKETRTYRHRDYQSAHA